MSFVFNDALAVRAQIESLLASYPELVDDEMLLLDSLEGETDLHRILEKIVAERQEAEAMTVAIKTREDALKARRERFERKSEAMKSLARMLMRSAQTDKVVLPEASLFVTKPRQSADIIDVEQLPQGYFKTVRQPDAKAILTALQGGEVIPGAEIKLGMPGLTIRSK